MSYYDVENSNLVEATTLNDSDVLIGYSARNLRTRGWMASTLATYMKTRISPVAVNLNTTTNIVTVTLGDGSVIDGTVTS